MTDAPPLRPTWAGILKFALFYASFIAIPIGITFLAIEGVSAQVLVGVVGGYLVAAVAFAALVASGLYGLTPTDAGLRSGRRRSRVLAWSEIDRIETGTFLGREIWVRVLGHPDGRGKPAVLAVFPGFLYGMSPSEFRDYLLTYRSRRTGSPT
ncbi:MAG TPA: hypothetical protein VFV72_06630 [Candidatus Limnocylindrales bacterium]|nr:hypothetical protein [Candidatus Limnocylindrales bacterium]